MLTANVWEKRRGECRGKFILREGSAGVVSGTAEHCFET
jgi:hypothetical protein